MCVTMSLHLDCAGRAGTLPGCLLCGCPLLTAAHHVGLHHAGGLVGGGQLAFPLLEQGMARNGRQQA